LAFFCSNSPGTPLNEKNPVFAVGYYSASAVEMIPPFLLLVEILKFLHTVHYGFYFTIPQKPDELIQIPDFAEDVFCANLYLLEI
jgi:hypothetical protein